MKKLKALLKIYYFLYNKSDYLYFPPNELLNCKKWKLHFLEKKNNKEIFEKLIWV
jgi:hypothetical protein